MSALVILLSVIIGVVGLIFTFMTISRFGNFMLNWADSMNNVPDWIGANSFFSWVLFILALFVAAWTVRVLVGFALKPFYYMLYKLFGKKFIDNKANGMTLVLFFSVNILLWMILFALMLWGNTMFFDFAASHPDFTNYYEKGDVVGIIIHSFIFMGIVFQRENTEEF